MFNEQPIISAWLADMYEQTETQTDDVEFLLAMIGSDPKRVLEIACGSGRILVPFAKAGHDAVGIDFDEHMLAKIGPKARGLRNIAWHKADAVRGAWGQGYNVVVLAGNFLFNVISDEDYETAQRLLIEKAAEALVSGGHLFIDYGYTLHPEEWFDDPKPFVVWEGEDSRGTSGRMMISGSTYDRESGINRFMRRFELRLADGRIIEQDMPCLKHFATLEQTHSWLDSSGFAVEEEYGDRNRNPISEQTSRAILWARKNKRIDPLSAI